MNQICFTWLVELVSNMPIINSSSFSAPRKKLHLLQHPDFSFDGQFPVSSLLRNPLGPSNPLCYLSDNAPAGIQGARHAQIGISLFDLHLNNKLQAGLFPSDFWQFNQDSRISNGIMTGQTNSKESLSCLLSIRNSCQNLEKSESVKKHQFLLFGQPMLTGQQIIHSCSTDTVFQASSLKRPTDVHPDRAKFLSNGSESSWHQGLMMLSLA